MFIAVSGAQVFFAFQPGESLWVFVPLMAINMALLGFIGSNFGATAMSFPFFNIAGARPALAHQFVRMTMAALLGGAIGYAFDAARAQPPALSLLASGLTCLVPWCW